MSTPPSDEIDVRYVADLARLNLSEEEVATFQPQLARILEYIHQLDELEIGDIEPMAHPVDLQNVFREDELRPSMDREAFLANAPAQLNGQITVPKILE